MKKSIVLILVAIMTIALLSGIVLATATPYASNITNPGVTTNTTTGGMTSITPNTNTGNVVQNGISNVTGVQPNGMTSGNTTGNNIGINNTVDNGIVGNGTVNNGIVSGGMVSNGIENNVFPNGNIVDDQNTISTGTSEPINNDYTGQQLQPSQSELTTSSSDEMGVGTIVNILMIVVGIVIILLGFAILVKSR